MQDVFKIQTVNNTYGEVYVNAPLDRESVDRYLLRVRQYAADIHLTVTFKHIHLLFFLCVLYLISCQMSKHVASLAF